MAIKIESFKEVLKLVQKSARARDRKNKTFNYAIWFHQDGNHGTVGDVIKHPCGTSGCLGGWGALLRMFNTKCGPSMSADQWNNECLADDRYAAGYYGITGKEADYLFYGYWHKKNVDCSDKDVIAKLKNIIKTGKVINEAFDKKYGGPTGTWSGGKGFESWLSN